MAEPPLSKEITKILENWNPMQEMYSNQKLNKYDSGPGANMAPALHASSRQQHKQNLNNTNSSNPPNLKPFLIFENVPSEMKEDGMRSLCAQYGLVTAVRFNPKFRKFFVDFKTVSDMEAVFRALVKNEYGFTVKVGKHFNKTNDVAKNNSLNSSNQDSAELANVKIQSQAQSRPDFENRNWELSAKQLPRPKFNANHIVRPLDYENKQNLLNANDPRRWFCVEDDAHAHEVKNFKLDMNSYRNGRTYIEMPHKIQDLVEGAKEKLGTYNTVTNVYAHAQGNVQKPKNIGLCENCGLESDMSCCRCNTYFCSRECQIDAWPKHRLICVRLAISKVKSMPPDFEEITEINARNTNLKNDIPAVAAASNEPKKQYSELPKSGETVVITSINKANTVFVRAKNKEADLNYFKLISKVHAEGSKLPKLINLPKKGQIVVAEFESQYNRCMVLNIKNFNEISIIHLEYGNLDMKPLNELYEAPKDYADIEKLVIPVLLKNVPDCYLTKGLRAFMYSKLENVVFKLHYKEFEDLNDEKAAYVVELIDTMSNQNLNNLICKLCTPVAKDHVDAKCYEYSKAMKFEPLPTGENVELVIMDNSLLKTGILYCTTKSYALEIQKFQKDLQLYGESKEDEDGYAPTYLELCIVKYEIDNQWYRGVGLENVGDGYPSIQFLDYGNTAAVPLKNIRRYPEQFLFPKFTSPCEIDGLLKNFNGNLLSRLEELLATGETIHCDNVEVMYADEENKSYKLKLSNIVDQLKQEGLLYDMNSEID